MKVAFIFAMAGLAHSTVIKCHADNCARQVTGTRAGLLPITSRQADCSSFQIATVTPLPRTITVTAWVGGSGINKKRWLDLEPRQVTAVPTAVPAYASACNAGSYASACNCWGIVPTTVTARTPRVTVTTTTRAGDCTSFALAAVPTCAFACLEAAVPQVGCNALTDLGCLCVPSVVGALYGVVPACVAQACPVSLIGSIDAGVSNACACHTATFTARPTTTPAAPTTTPAAPTTTPAASTTSRLPACQP